MHLYEEFESNENEIKIINKLEQRKKYNYALNSFSSDYYHLSFSSACQIDNSFETTIDTFICQKRIFKKSKSVPNYRYLTNLH